MTTKADSEKDDAKMLALKVRKGATAKESTASRS